MKKILLAALLSSALAAPTASAATVGAVASPSFDALTRGRATSVASATATPAPNTPPRSTTAPATTIRTTPVAATPASSAPTTETATLAGVTSADTIHWLYAGAQVGDSIVGGLLGLQINKMYSLEARYDYVDTLYQPNNTVKSSSVGIAGVAMFPLKLSDMEPFFIFAKTGFERSTVKSTTVDSGLPGISGFPPTTTATTTIIKRVMVGGGAQYDFSKKVSGRIGVNFIGSDHSVYLAAIYKL